MGGTLLAQPGSNRSPCKAISYEYPFSLNHIRWAVGKGEKIQVWEDIWAGDLSLCKEFPYF